MYKTSKLVFSPRVRKSPYFNSTIKYGAQAFSVYNHMYMPVSYDGPIEDYNNLLTSKNFWKQINGENILIFQTDTCLCSKNKHKIYNILKYDYVGAPWKSKRMPKMGGNGGLSFRKKSKMLQVCDKYKNGNEDNFFSSRNLFYPDKKLSQNIFVETIFSENPFGVHKVWNYINGNKLDILKKNCPEINTIFGK